MTTNYDLGKFTIGVALFGAAAPALLLLGAGTAQAVPDVAERGAVAIIDDLPTPRDCGSCGMFDPQPDPPGFPDPGSRVGLGGPDTLPPVRGFNPQPDPPSAHATEYVQLLPIPS